MTNVDAFASALKKGLGRAMILLRQDPLNPAYRGALLHACKTNQVFDAQCEEPRAPYLCKLIHETGAEREFWEALSLEFAEEGNDPDGDNRTQMFAVLCGIAGADPNIDRTRLRPMLSGADFQLVARRCLENLVQLDGISGLEFCFSTFEHNLVEEEWQLGSLVYTLRERDGADTADVQIRHTRERDANFDRLMSIADARNHPSKPEGPVYGREDIKAMLAAKQGIPYPWIKNASKEDCDWAAAFLLSATTDHERQQLLHLFRSHDFPGNLNLLISIARDPNLRVARAATTALERISHPDVRSFAMQLLKEGVRVSDGIRLLARNWKADDLLALELAFAATGDDEYNIHDVACRIPDVLRNAPPGTCNPANLLLRIYERNPCTTCRIEVMEALVHHGCVPEWLAEECQYDAEPRVTALISKS
jgi:hypothetical protein